METELRNERIISLTPMVLRIARSARRRVPFYDLDDLMSEGMIGAIQAVDRWDPDNEASLETFASKRVSGQIWDFIRKDSPLSRGHYAAVKAGEETFHLGSLDEPVSDGNNAGGQGPTLLIDLLPDEEEAIARIVDQIAVNTVVDVLPEKYSTVLKMYHWGNLSLAEIGERQGVTESRACQKLQRAYDYAYHYLQDEVT